MTKEIQRVATRLEDMEEFQNEILYGIETKYQSLEADLSNRMDTMENRIGDKCDDLTNLIHLHNFKDSPPRAPSTTEEQHLHRTGPTRRTN